MQHYAALGGDAVGAAQVNLAAGDRPSDVYTYVANMVEKSIADDLANGNKYAQVLAGKVSRKVVKQTVGDSLLYTAIKEMFITVRMHSFLFRS